MSQQVPRVATPANSQGITSAIVSAWKQVFGNKPKLSQVAKTWAQISVETGRGKNMFNNNVGNIIWTKGNSHDYYQTTDSKSRNGNPSDREWYKVFMRAYPSLVDGVADYLTLLKNRGSVMETLVKGSPQEFSSALAGVHYYDPYTENDYTDKSGKKVSGYTSGLTSLYNEFISNYRKGKVSGHPAAPTQSEPEHGGLIDTFLAKLDGFVSKLIGASEHTHLLTVKSSNDIASQIEYARILKSALQEELGIKSDIYTNHNQVDLEIASTYDNQSSEKAILEVANAISNIFTDATKKFANIKIDISLSLDKKSSLNELTAKAAEQSYRMFNLKVISGKQ